MTVHNRYEIGKDGQTLDSATSLVRAEKLARLAGNGTFIFDRMARYDNACTWELKDGQLKIIQFRHRLGENGKQVKP